MLFSPVISYRILLIEGREVPSLRSKIKAVAVSFLNIFYLNNYLLRFT